MIHWINDRNDIQRNISSALCRLISEGEIELLHVSRILGKNEILTSSILVDNTEEIEPAVLVELFKQFDLSPLYVMYEEGLPCFQTKTPTGRILRALNYLFTQMHIDTCAQYFRMLNVSSNLEYTRLVQGAFEMNWQDVLNICITQHINPAWIYNPNAHTPMLVK